MRPADGERENDGEKQMASEKMMGKNKERDTERGAEEPEKKRLRWQVESGDITAFSSPLEREMAIRGGESSKPRGGGAYLSTSPGAHEIHAAVQLQGPCRVTNATLTVHSIEIQDNDRWSQEHASSCRNGYDGSTQSHPRSGSTPAEVTRWAFRYCTPVPPDTESPQLSKDAKRMATKRRAGRLDTVLAWTKTEQGAKWSITDDGVKWHAWLKVDDEELATNTYFDNRTAEKRRLWRMTCSYSDGLRKTAKLQQALSVCAQQAEEHKLSMESVLRVNANVQFDLASQNMITQELVVKNSEIQTKLGQAQLANESVARDVNRNYEAACRVVRELHHKRVLALAAKLAETDEVPPWTCCPIMCDIMNDPVVDREVCFFV